MITPTIKPTYKQHLAWTALGDKEVKVSCGRCLDPFECEDCIFLNFIYFGGGAGGGKSWLGCEWETVMCYQYPESRWYIGRNELKRLMQSTYVTFQKVCRYHNIPKDDWKLNGQYNYIEFFNGSRIDLLDLKYLPSDPLYERFGSTEYTGGWIEEAGEIHFGAVDVLKSRGGRHLNKEYRIPAKTLYTFNPKKNWLYTSAYKLWKEHKLPKDSVFIQALYRDNPHTAGQYGKMLSQIKDRVTRQRLKQGIWEYDDDPGALMTYDNIIDIFTNAVEDVEDRWITCDAARFGGDKIVIYVWRGLEVYKVYVYRRQSTVTTEDRIKEVAREERVPYSHIITDEDGVGGGIVDHLPGTKGFLNNSSPMEDPRYEDHEDAPNYRNLKSQCYWMLADDVNNHVIAINLEYFYSEDDEITEESFKDELTQELEQVKKKDPDDDEKKLQVIPKEEMKEALGRSPDYADALMMRQFFKLNPPREKTRPHQYKPKVRAR